MIDKKYPLVSVVCLCYNHQDFVEEAIGSVLTQDYPNIELIVIDDASVDNSADVLKRVCRENNIEYIINSKNLGNCAAFNTGYKLCKGDFIIDLAADDILLGNRISTGVGALEQRARDFGVHYSNAILIDEGGHELGLHTELTKTIDPLKPLPEGDIFSDILARYFICPPTLMARREVFDTLGGYDESLSFEDFDFLVRASREYKFCYTPEALVKRRIVSNSKSGNQYRMGSKDLWSILTVCKKAIDLLKNETERKALNERLQYECRQVIIHNEPGIVKEYIDLMEKNGLPGITRTLYRIMGAIYPKVFYRSQ